MAHFLTKTDEGAEFSLIAHKGMEQNADLRLGSRNPIVLWLTRYREVLTRSDMEVFPQFKALWDQERERLEINWRRDLYPVACQ